MHYNKKVESLDKNLLSLPIENNIRMVCKENCQVFQLVNGSNVKSKLKKTLNSL